MRICVINSDFNRPKIGQFLKSDGHIFARLYDKFLLSFFCASLRIVDNYLFNNYSLIHFDFNCTSCRTLFVIILPAFAIISTSLSTSDVIRKREEHQTYLFLFILVSKFLSCASLSPEVQNDFSDNVDMIVTRL